MDLDKTLIGIRVVRLDNRRFTHALDPKNKLFKRLFCHSLNNSLVYKLYFKYYSTIKMIKIYICNYFYSMNNLVFKRLFLDNTTF